MHLSRKDLLPDSPTCPPRQEAWPNKDYHARKRPYLLARNAALSAARRFFESKGFTEVDTFILQRSGGNETHLHAFATKALAVDGAADEDLYLHTSPEFACKKLLSMGEEKIFTLARSFRNREAGPLHAREFTMLEWYRTGASLADLMEDCRGFVQAMARAVKANHLCHGERSADIVASPEILTLSEALENHAGIDLNSVIDADGNWRRDKLAACAGVRVAQDDTAGDIFSRILVEKIEPRLGDGRLTYLTRYPMAEAALARSCADDARFAERFELYACGVELANAFDELTDPQQQRARFTEAMNEKQRIYHERYPLDEDFLAALAHMPQACGIALGFERLLMLLLGAKDIRDVMWAA